MPIDQSIIEYSGRVAGRTGVKNSYGSNLNKQKETTPSVPNLQPPPQELPIQESQGVNPLTQPKPLPFMAKSLDANGNPYYGDGFQGWARKTYATLFAPEQYDYNDPNVQAQWESVKQSTQQALEKGTSWSSWGEKIFGITTEEMATAITAEKGGQAKAANQGESVLGTQVSQVVSKMPKMLTAGWDTVTRVLGVTDWASRKAVSFRTGVHEAADSIVDKTPPPETDVEQKLSRMIIGSPLGAVYDATRLATALLEGRTSFTEIRRKVDENMAGSAMIYSMVMDQAKKNEFISRYNAGENPTLLAEELQNPWIELAGSIFNDPLTWEGAPILNIGKGVSTTVKIPILGKELMVAGKTIKLPWEVVGHLPTVGDALAATGIKIGKARLIDEASKFSEPIAPIKAMTGEFKSLADLSNVPEAKQKLVQTATKVANDIVAYADNYSPSSLEAVGKAAEQGRVAADVIQNVLTAVPDTEEAFQIFGYYDKIHHGTEAEKAIAAAALLSHPLAPVLVSERGLQTGHFISKLYAGGKIQNIIDAADGDKLKLATSLFSHYENVLHETFASVDDMWNATQKIKKGLQADEATVKLAERYKQLPQWVRGVRDVTRKVDAVHAPVVGTMGQVYIRWNPAFFAKNIEGQSIRIMMDMGLGAGTEITARAAAVGVPVKGADYAAYLTSEHIKDSENMLGFAHEAISRGFGGGAKDILKTAKGDVSKFAASRAEAVTSGEIVVRTLRDTIQKALKVVFPGKETEALEKALPGSQDLLYSLLKKYDGNYDKAIAEFNGHFAKGYIRGEQQVQMTPKLRQFLSDNHMLEEVEAIRDNAYLSGEEVVQRIQDLVAKKRSVIEASLSKVPATLGSDVAKEMPELADSAMQAQELYHAGEVAYGTADSFTRQIQAWQNARKAMGALQDSSLAELGAVLDAAGRAELVQNVQKAQAVNSAYNDITRVRNTVRQIYQESKKGGDIQDLIRRAVVGDIFDVKKFAPNIDMTSLSHREFNKMLWEAYYRWSNETFHAANVSDFNTKMDAFSKAAEKAGYKFDAMMKNNGLFKNAYKAMGEAEKQYEYGSLASKLMPEGIMLDKMAPQALKEYGWTRGRDAILYAVNADRRAKGLAEAKDASQVPFEEALQAMADRGAKIPGLKPSEKVAETGATDLQREYEKLNNELWSTKDKSRQEAIKKRMVELDDLARPAATRVGDISEKAVTLPRSDLPPELSDRIARTADVLLGELREGQPGKRIALAPGMESATNEWRTIGIPSTNAPWYRELYHEKGINKSEITKALQKIIEDKGKDKGVNVERMKDLIIKRLMDGEPKLGYPPDLYALKQLGASDATMRDALEEFNRITGKEFTLEDALVSSGMPIDDVAAYARKGTKPAAEVATQPQLLPPPYNGERPSYAMALYQNLDGFEADMTKFAENLKKTWGVEIPLNEYTPQAKQALDTWHKAYESRMAVVRTYASALATAKRDFLLHSYDKTYLDHAFAYLSPFHYWTDRTYARTLEQLVENPGFAAAFAKYQDYTEKQHAGLPEWWKYNVQVPDLLGMDASHPLFINLVASLNPLNGLIGTDFNDPYKRTDWVSKTVDDLNKFGPTFSPLIQWAVGLHLYQRGDIDAGQRWFGRLMPQTAYVKAGLTLGQNAVGGKMWNLGPFVQNNEVDPFVNFIEGGLDPYERGRVGRALSSLEQQRVDAINQRTDLTKEQKDQMIGDVSAQMNEAAFSHKGPIWDEAVHLATTIRAPGQLSAAILGIGAKPRTQSDMEIDQFYGELNHLYALSSTVSPEDYKAGWDALRDKYPFMDTLLLARKGDNVRDSSYAYNVLGRLPPAESTQILEQVGIQSADINKFYDSKGFTDPNVKYTDTEKQRFMSAVLDLGTMLSMPNDATKQDWQTAKTGYAQIKDYVSKQVNDPTIWDKVDQFYSENSKNADAGSKYLTAHPEVGRALDMQRAYIIASPNVAKYYSSLQNIDRFYDTQARAALERMFGRNIYAEYSFWQDIVDSKESTAYYKAHPELKQFSAAKKAYQEKINQAVIRTAKLLPEGIPGQLRQDYIEQSAAQGRLAGAVTGPETVPAATLLAEMSPALKRVVAAYFRGEELPNNAYKNLDFIGSKFDLSGDEVLQIIGVGQ